MNIMFNFLIGIAIGILFTLVSGFIVTICEGEDK